MKEVPIAEQHGELTLSLKCVIYRDTKGSSKAPSYVFLWTDYEDEFRKPVNGNESKTESIWSRIRFRALIALCTRVYKLTRNMPRKQTKWKWHAHPLAVSGQSGESRDSAQSHGFYYSQFAGIRDLE